LDAAAAAVVIDLLRERKAQGTSIIGVFHNIDAARDLVDGVVRMRRGVGVASMAAGPL
jgi:alpha-D-ribose 1-methylphosphonate 5-triphosphate synthase subunit PhnL